MMRCWGALVPGLCVQGLCHAEGSGCFAPCPDLHWELSRLRHLVITCPEISPGLGLPHGHLTVSALTLPSPAILTGPSGWHLSPEQMKGALCLSCTATSEITFLAWLPCSVGCWGLLLPHVFWSLCVGQGPGGIRESVCYPGVSLIPRGLFWHPPPHPGYLVIAAGLSRCVLCPL